MRRYAHTQGEYQQGRFGVVTDQHNNSICDFSFVAMRNFDPPTIQGNVNLFLAAPKMLALLEQIVANHDVLTPGEQSRRTKAEYRVVDEARAIIDALARKGGA